MSTCQGCGIGLAPPKKYGRPRKWCSDRCRKQTLYSTPCVNCGTPTTGDGSKHELCAACNTLATGARNTAARVKREQVILALRAEGLSNRDIAARTGSTASAIAGFLSRQRHWYGVDVPRDPYMENRRDALGRAA